MFMQSLISWVPSRVSRYRRASHTSLALELGLPGDGHGVPSLGVHLSHSLPDALDQSFGDDTGLVETVGLTLRARVPYAAGG